MADSLIKAFGDKSPQIHETAFVSENTTIIGDVTIGADSSVWFGSVLRGDVNSIKIGERTNVQDNSVIHVTSFFFPTVLENEVTVGHRVVLHGCHVESNCLIGIGSIVLDGARIGKNSLIAANSLVTPGTQIPPNSFVLGSPARVKRELTAQEILDLNGFWQNYVNLKALYQA